MRLGETCFKGEGCIHDQTENNRKRSGGKEAEPEPDFVKKRDKESGAGQPHTANKYPTQKDRKTQENTRNFAACTLLYTI